MRLILDGNSGSHLVGFAKNKFRDLQTLRKSLGLPVMDKIIRAPGGYRISIYSSDWKDVVRISGGSPLILLSDNSGNHAAGFNYLTGSIAPAKVTQAPTGGGLIGLFNGRSQLASSSFSTYLRDWSTGRIGPVVSTDAGVLNTDGAEFLASLPEYEIGFFVMDGDHLVVSKGDDISTLFLTAGSTPLPEFCGGYGNSLGYVSWGHTEGPLWNQYWGPVLYSFNPEDYAVSDDWYWVPSLFTVYPGSYQGLFPGWYYGSQGSPRYGFDEEELHYNPLTYAEIKLKAIVDNRSQAFGVKYGWCECVNRWETENDSGSPHDLFFYLSDIPFKSYQDSYEYYENKQTGQHSLINVGTSLSGFSPSAHLSGQTLGMDDPTVDLWSFTAWNDPDKILTDTGSTAVGIVIHQDRKAMVYRYKGSLTKVYETTNYHSHDRSSDGKYLAIFEGGSSAISGVRVFDLYGTKEGKDYVSGGFTDIGKEHEISWGSQLTQGVFINFRDKNFEPKDFYPVWANSEITQDKTLSLPAYGQVNFFKDGRGPCTIQKIACKSGDTAVFEKTVDECFESVIVVGDPDNGVPEEKLVGTWNVAGGLKGVVRGNFEKEGDDRRFYGVGDGDEITLDPTLPLIWSAMQDKPVIDAIPVGDVIYGQGFTEEGEADLESAFSCGDPPYLHFEVRTSCGQFGEIDREISELEMSGEDAAEVGAGFQAWGSKGPYTWEFDSGTIDVWGDNHEHMKIVTVTDCTGYGEGTPAMGTVTVRDICGNEVSLDIRLPGGGWVFESCEGDCTAGAATCYQYWKTFLDDEREWNVFISGDTKQVYTWCATAHNLPYSSSCSGEEMFCCEDCSLASLGLGSNDFVFETIRLTGIKTYKWVC